MKTLYLARHAKSSWEQPGMGDEERPLLPKGVERSLRVIDFLLQQQVRPDLILTSPAVRALETARLFARGLHYPEGGIVVDRKIYDGYYDRILDLIYQTGAEIGSLMMFGHNPTITNLANLFLHPGIEAMPTSAVVAIQFDAPTWEEIPRATSRQLFIVSPKTIK